jgi:hypothetical protein
MNIIKGFALNRAYFDNTHKVVSNIGELSSLGFTASKEHPVYSNLVTPTISLVHFPTKDSDVGFESELPKAQVDHVIAVASAVYALTAINAGVPTAPGQFADAVIQAMGPAVTDVRVGAQVRQGEFYCIEYISWKNTEVAIDNFNQIWFSNDAFLGQFDQHEYTVVLPFEPADAFFGHPDDVKELLAKFTYNEEIGRIQQARGKYQETILWGETYDYVNPANKLDRTPAKFSVLIYGPAGMNEDLLKEAIVDKLLDGSAYTRDQWKEILPDLFRRTEYLVFPQYQNVAVENLAGQGLGMFSPVTDPTEVLNQLVRDAFDYPEAHVRANGQAFAFPFQSIALHTIGNVENRDDKVKIRDWFPDYFFTGITSFDFGRMSEVTREWVIMLNTMLQMAEKMNTGTAIPIGYSKITRGDIVFLAKNYLKINWLVAIKNQ